MKVQVQVCEGTYNVRACAQLPDGKVFDSRRDNRARVLLEVCGEVLHHVADSLISAAVHGSIPAEWAGIDLTRVEFEVTPE